MRRLIVFLTIVCSTAVGAWALPAGQASPTVDHVAARPVPVEAPFVSEPQVAEPAVSSAPATAGIGPLEVHDVLPVLAGGQADHLVPVRAEEHAPEVIVTTTTAPPTTTAPAPIVTVAFSAQQAYGSCGEDVPYDVFSGAASPGSTVTISSPFGSGSATADGHGHWERKIEFPSAPRGESFAVAVSGLGGSTTFRFTATGAAHG